ncbi:hypothetical protein BU26DRAFT_564291 [Trematosphaeria pertusa]|uniref:Uncharacterized protein n=1 Tax=Trematosphaeria pertusa TaxID=390896 RepID=A0A6A6ILL1_9PLEO|nr:uncharacterized protein BU26DRAFT_564291 [Trematosphaeria pertusa]KAF2250440.1 hypothetical protein BU26DRAFT_564291 [Trematosphaeria pertusa]
MGDKSSDCHPQPRKNTSKMSATPLAARGDRINKLNPAVIHEYSDSLKPTCSEVARVESNGEKENTDSEKQRLLFKGAIDRGGENKAPDPNQTTREDLDRDTTSDVPATGTEDFRALLRRLLKDNNDIPGATTDDKTEHLLGVAKDIKHIKEIVGLLDPNCKHVLGSLVANFCAKEYLVLITDKYEDFALGYLITSADKHGLSRKPPEIAARGVYVVRQGESLDFDDSQFPPVEVARRCGYKPYKGSHYDSGVGVDGFDTLSSGNGLVEIHEVDQ